MSITIKIKKLRPEAKVPQFAHPGDAGMDVCSTEHVVLGPGERRKIGTGLAFELPDGHVALAWDKSGLATNKGLKNLGGVIDAGYRGEVFITLVNLAKDPHTIEVGDKIAQFLIQKVERPKIVETEELSETARGAGGFGSTGKK